MKISLKLLVAAFTALVVGALLVVSAGLGGTASGGATKGATFAPSSPQAVRVSIGMRVVPRIARRGQTVSYLLRVSNVGSDPAAQLRVCNQIPQGLTLVSGPPHFRRVGGLTCRTFTSLPIGATAIGNFRMKVSPSARVGVVVNTASARATGMARVTAQARLRVVLPCPSRGAVRLLC